MTPNQVLLRRKALSAAASVVLALGTAGCGPSPETGGTVASDDASTADSGEAGSPEQATCEALEGGAQATCCEALRDACNDEYGEDTPEAHDCYYGPDLDGSTGCIPWGPPAPPEFREALA